MIRPLLFLKRLFFDETAGKVHYQYSRHGSKEESTDYLEFIARVTPHIPHIVKVKKEQGHQQEIEDLGMPIHLGVLVR